MKLSGVLAVGLLALAPVAIAKRDKTAAGFQFQQKLSKDQQVRHALDRLSFGAREGDQEELQRLGLKKWLDRQLHPERIEENPVVEAKLAPLESLRMQPSEIAEKYPRKQAAAGGAQAPLRTLNTDLIQGKLYRAIYSNRQFNELMVDFWYNHFNVFFRKGADPYLVAAYERETIRPRVFGKFSDLLEATAKSPAMLFYLDNWQSVSPALAGVQTKRPKQGRGLNENYARELMELHTLGVDGGYTQKDIVEVARCFTGWTIRNPRQGGEFVFNPRVHDRGEKVVLGVTIPAGGGMDEGVRVLDILAHHPSTARFISRKLAMRFVADTPPATLVERMAKTFTSTGGDIRAVLKTMLDAPEFWSEGAYRAKVKTPFEMVVSAVRVLNADVENAMPLGVQIAQLGQPLYAKVEPTGYSSGNAEWVSSSALLARMNFGIALAAGKLRGVKVDSTQFAALPEMSPETRAAVDKGIAESGKPATPALTAGLVLGSPEFQRR